MGGGESGVAIAVIDVPREEMRCRRERRGLSVFEGGKGGMILVRPP